MNKKQIVASVSEEIKNIFLSHPSSSHDWWHVLRVWNNAKHIGKKEGADLFVVELGALLHDINDWKYSKDGEDTKQKILDILTKYNIDSEIVEKVIFIAENISFKGGAPNKMKGLEGLVVQDADRLDAIGAIGIARAFSGAGEFKETFYDPAVPIPKFETEEGYVAFKKSDHKRTTINHFYEKLLRLKDLMNTATGKKLAKSRHEYMEKYLARFFKEWRGEL